MRRFITAWLLALIIILAAATTDTYTSLRHESAQLDTVPSLTSKYRVLQPSSSPLNLRNVISRAKQKAISGGLSGLIAGAIQVVTLMWLRTTVNYQYRYGVSMATAIRELYRQGGIPRFYRGLPYALVQGPLARFGGIAANDAAIVFTAYLTGKSEVLSKGVLSTALGSVLAGLWRVILMPIDTCKTVLQVDGARGYKFLIDRVWRGDISALYTGAAATTFATMISHYPWFIVHNILDTYLSNRVGTIGFLLRSSFIGFCSSAVSDTISNSVRVIKTVKQASAGEHSFSMSYRETIIKVHAESGIKGIFGRGLKTRILTNGIQSILFTVIWKLMSRKNGGQPIEYSKYDANIKVSKDSIIAKESGKKFLRQSS